MKKTNIKQGIQFGLILGIISGIATAYGYAINNKIYFNYWFLGILILLPILLAIMAIVFSKKQNGGFISYKEAFAIFFITIFIGLLISTFVNILVFNVIDPDFQEVVKNVQIEGLENQKDKTIEKLYNSDTPESSIIQAEEGFDKAIEKMRDDKPYEIGKQFKGFFYGVAIYAALGLIISLFFRKKDKNEY